MIFISRDSEPLLDNLPIGVYKTDSNGTFIYANLKLASLLGFSSVQELMQCNSKDFFSNPETRRNELINTKFETVYTEEVSLVRRDGTRIYVIDRYTRYIENSGKVFFEGTIEDITEIKELEIIRKSENADLKERFLSLYQYTNDAIFLHDFDGAFIDANPAALKLLGYDRDEFMKLKFSDIISSEQIDFAFRLTSQVRLAGIQQELSEFKLYKKDGSTVWVETFTNAIYQSGKPIAVQGIAKDITHRKLVEQKLSESLEQFNKLILSMPNSAFILRDDRIQITNEAAHRFTGFTDEYLLGRSFFDICSKEYHHKIADNIYKTISTGNTSTNEIELVVSNNQIRYAEVTYVSIDYADMKAALVILKDISELRSKDEQLRQKENFHDNVINSIGHSLAVISSDDRILSMNKNFIEFFSSRYEIDGNIRNYKFTELISPFLVSDPLDKEKEIKQAIDLLLTGNSTNQEIEYSLYVDNGQIKWYRLTLNKLSNGTEGIVISQYDISEKKNRDLSRDETRIKMQTILDNSIQSFILTDENGIIVSFNDVAMRFIADIFRFQPEIGMNIESILEAGEPEKFVKLFRDALKGQSHAVEKSYKTLDGNEYWFIINFLPVNSGGRITGVVLNAVDTTERKLAEQKLSEYRQSLEKQVMELRQIKKAVEQSASSIMITDQEGIITYANQTCELMTGYKADEIIGVNVNIFNSGFTNPNVFKELWSTISSGRSWKGEFINKKKNSSEYWEYASISPVIDKSGKITSYIAIKEDVTERKKIEEKMTGKEEKFNALLEAIPDFMFIFDEEANYQETYSLPKDEESFVFPSEFINKSVYDVLPKDIADLTKLNIELALKTNEIQLFHYELNKKDRKENYECRMVKCGKNKALAIIRNISRSRENENRIRKQEKIKGILSKWAGEFINVSPELFDVKINEAFADIGKSLEIDRVYLFKYDENENIAINTHEWCNEGIKSEINDLQSVPLEKIVDWHQTHKQGKTVLIEDTSKLPKNDSVRLILEAQDIKTVMSIPVINNNRCVGFVGFDSCKTFRIWDQEEILVLKFLSELIYNLLERIDTHKEKKAAEESIKRLTRIKDTLSKWAREFINVSPDMYDRAMNQTLDELGRVVDMDRVYLFKYDFDNKLAINTHEWCRDGIRPGIDMFPVVPFENLMGWMEHFLKGKLILIQDVDTMSDDDNLKNYLVSQGTKSALGIPIYNNGKCLGFVGFDAVNRIKVWNEEEVMVLKVLADLLYNLQDRLQTQLELISAMNKAEESERLKSAFLANMSHEIRTPLNGIIGFSKLLMNNQLSDKEKLEYAGLIKSSSRRLIELIDNILDISQLESGKMDIVNSPVNINDLMKELYSYFENKAFDKELDFKISVNSEQNPIIVTDKNKISQILSNLVDNAIKFTPRGYINLSFNLLEEEAEFIVEDSGLGIDEDFMPYMFDRFRQEDANPNRAYEGSGIGLAIVKGLTEILQGRIKVESEKGKGSKFFVYLPFKYITFDKITKLRPEPVMVLNWKESVILIAEDDEINYKYVDKLLSRVKGVTTVRARNGREVVDIAINRPEISLILMDIKMPLLDGHSATKMIKEVRPDLPIIAVTAFAMLQDKVAAKNAGCDDYVSKPYEADDILNIIDKYLSL